MLNQFADWNHPPPPWHGFDVTADTDRIANNAPIPSTRPLANGATNDEMITKRGKNGIWKATRVA
jgi:hypothetical protein